MLKAILGASIDKCSRLFLIAAVFTVLIFSNSDGFAKDISSLKSRLNEASDAERAKIHEEIAWISKDVRVENLIKHGRLSLRYSNLTGDLFTKSSALNRIGEYHYITGHYDSAVYYFKKSFFLRKSLKDKRSTAGSSQNLGLSYLKLEALDSSKKYLELSETLFKSEGNNEKSLQILTSLIIIDLKKGNLVSARQQLNKLSNIVIKNRDIKADFHFAQAYYYLLNRNYTKSKKQILKSLKLSKKDRDTNNIASNLFLKAQVDYYLGNIDSTLNSYNLLKGVSVMLPHRLN